MAIDDKMIDRIAVLSRLELGETEKQALGKELNGILNWIEQLSDIDTDGVTPMTSVKEAVEGTKRRLDKTEPTAGAEAILNNAPARKLDYFTIPKVVE